MIRVLQRALAVLDTFTTENPRLSLHEITQAIGLPKSTTFRILATLVNAGYLAQTTNQEYGLSQKFLRLASVAQKSLGLQEIVHPILARLAEETGETVEISRLDGESRVCLDVVESSSPLKSIVSVGDRLPLLFGSSGKVLLANMPPRQLERTLASSEKGKKIDRVKLARRLQEVRQSGFALTRDERVIGATGISVPVRAHEDEIYSLTVTGPSARFVGREQEFCGLMLQAGKELSALLGGMRWSTDWQQAPRSPAKVRGRK
jgi:DNA-binding IclR family transcriptional regulator